MPAVATVIFCPLSDGPEPEHDGRAGEFAFGRREIPERERAGSEDEVDDGSARVIFEIRVAGGV